MPDPQRQCSLFLPSPPSHLLIQPFICTKELMALLDNNVVVIVAVDVVVRLSGYPVGQLTEIPPRSRRASTNRLISSPHSSRGFPLVVTTTAAIAALSIEARIALLTVARDTYTLGRLFGNVRSHGAFFLHNEYLRGRVRWRPTSAPSDQGRRARGACSTDLALTPIMSPLNCGVNVQNGALEG